MPFDGVTTACITDELNRLLKDGKIDKIYQPEADEIRLLVRQAGQTHLLVMSANASMPRVHLTADAKENPLSAPNFCMFLRKHLCGCKIIDFSQPGLERIIRLTVEGYDELGDRTQKYLYAEIMGRHSNLILVSHSGKILDAIKRVDFSVSSLRQVLPGLPYEFPPKQDKQDPLSCTQEEFYRVFSNAPKDLPVQKVLLQSFCGVSPLLARELTYRTFGQTAILFSEVSQGWLQRFSESCFRFFQEIKAKHFSPCVLTQPDTQQTMDYSPIEIHQYGNAATVQPVESISEAMNLFFHLRDQSERMRQRSASLLHTLTNHLERCRKKSVLQEEMRQQLESREELKICGDLLIANLYQIPAGADKVTLPNFYAENNETITISLDSGKTPSQNAQLYYKRYNKAKNAEVALLEQEKKNREEAEYLESVFDALSRASSPSEIAEIREELQEQGYLKKSAEKKKKQSSKMSEPLRFISSDGFLILTGRNNRQNDYVTLKLSRAEDLWFHTKNIPGSHTLIKSGGKKVPSQTLSEAAVIAAFHSKAVSSSNVPVDFTAVKNVKKPSGSKPGMVIYEHYRTLYVTPDKMLIDKLVER